MTHVLSIAFSVALLSSASAGQAQQLADFRSIPGVNGRLVIDLGTMTSDGDVRAFDMYMNPTEDVARMNGRARIRINCRDRTESIESVARQRGDEMNFDSPKMLNQPWAKADEDKTGALIVNLVCAPATERDRYLPRLSASNRNAAMIAAARQAASGDEKPTKP